MTSTLVVCWSGPGDVTATRRSVRRQLGDVDTTVVATVVDAARALEATDAPWITFVDAGDVLTRDAITQLLRVDDEGAPVDVVYSDETWDTSPVEPFYKPDWSPDRLRCQPYLGRLVLVRRSLALEAGGLDPAVRSSAVAEHDLLLRVTERARRVAHVPVALCRRPARPRPAFAPDDVDEACRAVDRQLDRLGLQARARPHQAVAGLLRLEPALTSTPLVSIVVPTAGTRRTVRGEDRCLVVGCVRSVLTRSTYTDVEVICVVDPTVDEALRAELAALDPARVRLVDFDEPFHFAHKINVGVLAASGDVIVFLNDDTEVASPGWLEAMLVYALDPDVGAVGARLLFEDDRIQHCGVVGVRGNPGHPYYGLPADTEGHGSNALVPGDFLAVTAACLMTRRELFDAAGGLSSWFPVNYNDIDYCLKVRRLGTRVVATPDAVLHHYESSSRSGEVAATELAMVRHRWGRFLRDDPYYGPNFPSGNADFVPAPV